MGQMRNVYKILVGIYEGKRPFERPWRRWKHNTKMDLRETMWNGIDWIRLAWDRDQWRVLVITAINEPSGSMQGRAFLD
jgi:hypothetical protein